MLPALAIAALAIAPVAAQNTSTNTANSVDQQFVQQASQANQMEIKQAQTELSNTSDAQVQIFARTMIRDHTAAGTQLALLANQLGIMASPAGSTSSSSGSTSSSSAPMSSSKGSMSSSSGSTMPPKQYMQQQVQAHQQTIALYKQEATGGTSQQLKTYASNTLPTLNQHLKMAQDYMSGQPTQSNPNPMSTY